MRGAPLYPPSEEETILLLLLLLFAAAGAAAAAVRGPHDRGGPYVGGHLKSRGVGCWGPEGELMQGKE